MAKNKIEHLLKSFAYHFLNMEDKFGDIINEVFTSEEDRKMAKRWLYIALHKPKTLEVTVKKDLDEAAESDQRKGK